MGSHISYVCSETHLATPRRARADYTRHIAASRHPIPDVPVLYLIEPTASNLQAITNDLAKGLYSPAYVNFLSSIPRPLLEDFAAQTASAGTSENIAQVFDQYLNFIVGEPDLFSLGMRKEKTYWALNSARTKDEELDYVVDRIVSGLFSVVVTMGKLHIFCENLFTDVRRCHSSNKVSKRGSCRNDICETGPKTSRSRTKFQGQPILDFKSSTCFFSRNDIVKTSPHHSRP
jgi:hypothetical protein